MPCEMDQIMSLAKDNNLYVIEDCAQAHGATFKDKPVGCFGDIAAWSFCQDKIITTGGEGGMIATNNFEYYKKIFELKDHGRNIEKAKLLSNDGLYKYIYDTYGSNHRMTEMQAALGMYQLEKLNDWVAQRNKNARVLDNWLSRLEDIRLIKYPRYIQHAYYKYYFFVDNNAPECMRDQLLLELNEIGIPIKSGAGPELYKEGVFADVLTPERHPNADLLGKSSVMLPVHPGLEANDLIYVAKMIEEILGKN